MSNLNQKTILVVDDEKKIIEVIASFLATKNFRVLSAYDGETAMRLFAENEIDMVLLDLMLPGIPGEEICMRIRAMSRVPVIMLTAKATENDLVDGLAYGADDYITKPFSLKELYARMEAVLRRTSDNLEPLIQKYKFNDGELIVDLQNRTILKQGKPVNLTPNEFRIFSTLIKHPTKTFTREELIDHAFGDDFEGFDRAVDSHIKNLRQKIETDPKNPTYVVTIHGIGYKFQGS